jgi:serine/threonine protein kinase
MTSYTLLHKIGKGTHTEVWKGSNEKGQMVAFKIYPKRFGGSEDLQNEISLHSSIDHPFIVKYIEAFKASFIENKIAFLSFDISQSAMTENNIRYAIVLELMSGTNLDEIYKNGGMLDNTELKQFVRDISCALTYLKSKNIIHRDVKPANVIYDADRKFFKLTDFGYAMLISEKTTYDCGSPYFIAPEILCLRKKVIELPYTFSTDVWSFGITIYFIKHGKYPWKSRRIQPFLDEIQLGVQESNFINIEDDLKSLLTDCLMFDPEKRIQIENVINHSYVKNN